MGFETDLPHTQPVCTVALLASLRAILAFDLEFHAQVVAEVTKVGLQWSLGMDPTNWLRGAATLGRTLSKGISVPGFMDEGIILDPGSFVK